MDSTTLKIVSTFSILVPIFVNGLRLKQAGTFGRLFFLFLLAGFTTDIAHWYAQFTGLKGISLHLFNGYAFFEAIFFFWLVRQIAPSLLIRKFSMYFLYGTPVAAFVLLLMPHLQSEQASQSAPFVALYEVSAAFLAGFALLAMAEREYRLLASWEFWFLSGVFCYCFCTFFVMTLLGSQHSLNLWPLNNIINIVTYLFYTLGWWNWRAHPTPRPLTPPGTA